MRNGQQSEVRLDGASETSAQIFSMTPAVSAIQSAANDGKEYRRARGVWISNFIFEANLFLGEEILVALNSSTEIGLVSFGY